MSIDGEVMKMPPHKIALLTDSCADLSAAVARENQIYIVPLKILCEDGEYSDGVDIFAADIYRRLKAGEVPKTSLPDGGVVTDTFDRIAAEGYDGVIALTLSGGLSGTYNMLHLLGEGRRDLKVATFDSISGSSGIGIVILQLAEDIRNGMSWEELTERRVPQLVANTKAFFSVDTLDYLQKGGRIGKVTAMAGTMLQIKPLLTFAGDGQLTSVAKVRGRKQVQDKLVELIAKACSGHKKYNLAVVNGGAREEMYQLREKLMAALPGCDHMWEGEMDGTLSVYIGDGVLGAAVQYLD